MPGMNMISSLIRLVCVHASWQIIVIILLYDWYTICVQKYAHMDSPRMVQDAAGVSPNKLSRHPVLELAQSGRSHGSGWVKTCSPSTSRSLVLHVSVLVELYTSYLVT